MLEDIEEYVFETYVKDRIVVEEGIEKVYKEDIENLGLQDHEKNFIFHVINKRKIKLVEENITEKDRSPYVRDNNYGEVKGKGLQKYDKPVKATVEYSSLGEKVFEDYSKLDEYLESRFIPTYVLLKQKKGKNGKTEYYPSIQLNHIMALRLSEAEVEHVMEYLKSKNVRVGGEGVTFGGEFENYDYIKTYKDMALPLSVPKEVTLEKIARYKETNDKALRDEIITDNMRLVPFVAYRYAISSKIDKHELESYGYEGLILALDNFDVSYGCAFSTYAIAYIRGYILSGIEKLKIGKRNNFYYHFINAKNAVERENGVTLKEDPELVEDVVDLLVAVGTIRNDSQTRDYARRRVLSLAMGEESLDNDLIEELHSKGKLVADVDVEDELIEKALKRQFEKILSTLSPREARVIIERFGLYGEAKTLDEVAEMFDLSRERIRQIEAKALRKLRHPSRAKKVTGYR